MARKIELEKQAIAKRANEIKPELANHSFQTLYADALKLKDIVEDKSGIRTTAPAHYKESKAHLRAILMTLQERQDHAIAEAMAMQDSSGLNYKQLEAIRLAAYVAPARKWQSADMQFEMYMPDDFEKVAKERAAQQQQNSRLSRDYAQGQAQAAIDWQQNEAQLMALTDFALRGVATEWSEIFYGQQPHILGIGKGWLDTIQAARKKTNTTREAQQLEANTVEANILPTPPVMETQSTHPTFVQKMSRRRATRMAYVVEGIEPEDDRDKPLPTPMGWESNPGRPGGRF